MYQIGDVVRYASFGVCTVKAIEKRDFSGEELEYYVLESADSIKNRFYIPTSNETLLSQLKSVCTRDEAEKIILDMPDEKPMWINEDIDRRDKYREIIKSGDRHGIVSIIKALYEKGLELSDEHKKLHATDERLMNEAENVLYNELSYALDIPREEVLPYIKERLADRVQTAS